MLSRPQKQKISTEDQVGKKMKEHISSHPKSFVLCSLSVSNITRLVQLFKATVSCGRILVIDAYTAAILRICKDKAKLMDFTWDKIRLLYLGGHAQIVGNAFNDWNLVGKLKYARNRIELDELARNPGKYVLPFRKGLIRHLEPHPNLLKNAIHLYSLWEGYLKQQDYVETQNFFDRHKIPTLKEVHVSGHAYVEDLLELAEIVNPKTIIPIHTKHPEKYEAVFKGFNVRRLEDGKEFDLSI